jgi:Amt family ammonium transporter
LGGLVSINGSCAYVEPYSALAIGAIGSVFYCYAVRNMNKFEIDDPLESCCVHGACGAWGTIAVGIFHSKLGVVNGKFELLGIQILGMVVLTSWSVITTGLMFLTMKYYKCLRLELSVEMIGLDIAQMGGLDDKLYDKMVKNFNENYKYTLESI